MYARVAAVAGLVMAAAACSSDVDAPPAIVQPSVTAQSAPAAAPAGKVLTGAGVTVTLPPGWKQVDPALDATPAVAGSFGLSGPNGDLLKSLIERQKKAGVVWAIDPAKATADYAPNLSAGCESGGLTGSSLGDLKKKAKLLNKDAQNLLLTDVTVSGKPGVRITYTKKDLQGVTTDTYQVRVPVSADQYCYVDVEASPGGLAEAGPKIEAGFAVGAG